MYSVTDHIYKNSALQHEFSTHCTCANAVHVPYLNYIHVLVGVILKVGTDIISIYTLWLLVILFQHRKKVMV